jgi:hypothetical protein
MTSTTNNNYIPRANILPHYSPNGMKKSTTYLNTTQLYITQPAPQSRNSSIINQKNSVTIPDFNSPKSHKTIYRSPVLSSPIERNNLEHRLNSLSIDNHHHIRDTTNESTIGEYFGRKLTISFSFH